MLLARLAQVYAGMEGVRAEGGVSVGRCGGVDVCSSMAARSSIIVFDTYEVVTEGNCPQCRRHDAKYALSYLFISIQEVVSRDTCLCANRSQR